MLVSTFNRGISVHFQMSLKMPINDAIFKPCDHKNFKMGSFAKNGQELPEIFDFEYCVKVVFFRHANGRILSKIWDKSGESTQVHIKPGAAHFRRKILFWQ